MTHGTAFVTFDSALNLDPRERLAAEVLHRDLTTKLQRRGLVRAGFLQGSFARKTMRRPLHDVDKVLLLPPDVEAAIRSQRGGPDRVMDALEAAITADYPGTTFKRKRHALGLTIPGRHFQFDAVPAFEIPGDRAVLIANREADMVDDEWEWSNTRLLIDVVAERNQACDGRFVHWVRMGKEMAAHRIGEGLPGLHIESLCFIANSDHVEDAMACEQFFRVAAARLDSGYYDPTGRDRLSDRLSHEVRVRASTEFSTASLLAAEARRLALNDDHDNACRLWQAIFGQAFPAPPAPTPQAALAASFAGTGLTSLGTPTSSPSAQRHIRPTRPWNP
jgi:Second Messenger Oligonucleotide or Dinucleotide Synthetase domain